MNRYLNILPIVYLIYRNWRWIKIRNLLHVINRNVWSHKNLLCFEFIMNMWQLLS